MKLDEIIQTNTRKERLKTTFDKSDEYNLEKRYTKDQLGSGMSYAAYDTDDPHEIEKRSIHPKTPDDPIDGNHLFIRSIVQNKMTGDNLWVPRVYNFNIATDSYGQEHYTFRLEKLWASYEVEEDEIIELIMDAIPEFNWDESMKAHPEVTGAAAMTTRLGFHLSLMVHGGIAAANKDLTDVLVLLKKLTQVGGRLDLHGGNIMYRRTPVGVQMVINDPIS
jgi:hypothetical protein